METALRICTEILEQRGYHINMITDNNIVGIHPQTEEQIVVLFCIISKFNVDKVMECMNIMNEINISHSIIVYKDTITPIARKFIENATNVVIELFTLNEVQINVTKHQLVPIHECLSDTDSEHFKQKYGTTYPTLLSTDAIARFYFFKKGQIVRIYRKNNTIAYRIVR